MKRILPFLLALMFIAMLPIGLAACSDGEYTVEFYVDNKIVNTEKTVNGQFSFVYTRPDNNSKFDGWYTDENYKNKYISNRVSKNMKLYGRIIRSTIPAPEF